MCSFRQFQLLVIYLNRLAAGSNNIVLICICQNIREKLKMMISANLFVSVFIFDVDIRKTTLKCSSLNY